MKTGWSLILAAGCAGALLAAGPVARAADSSAPVDRVGRDGQWTFSLLPKAFSREPQLDITVMSEQTTAGQMGRQASPENPVYYQAYDGGFQERGETEGVKPVAPATLDRAMTTALAHNGFLPAKSPEHPPSVLVIYHSGSYASPDPQYVRRFPNEAARQLMERAALIGSQNQMYLALTDGGWSKSFLSSDYKFSYLQDQASEGLYYAVASAYDYRAAAHGQHVLLWRTKLTVSSNGVSMRESMPTLIATAAPFFGKNMPEPAIAQPKVTRWGVLIGEPKVIETDISLPAPASSTPAAKPSKPAPPDHGTH